MSGGPATIALGDVVDLIMGQAPSSKDCNFDKQGTPFVKVGEFGVIRPVIREWTTNPLRMARRTDVLLCVVGATCGKINLGEECAIGRSVAAIRPNPSKLDQFYLYYFLMTLVERLRAGSVGAAQTVISKDMVGTLQIPFPPLQEQQRIVGILDEACEGIATAKAKAEKNLQNARDLFESQLQDAFTKRGPGWSEKRLVEIANEFGRGKSKHRPRNDPSLYNGPYPFVQTGDISNADHWLTDYSQTYSERGLAQSRIWPRGTICIAIVGATVGETAILNFDACFPDSVIGIVVNDKVANEEYVEFLLQSYKALLKEKGKGTARDNINLGTFENQKFPFPNLKQQEEIVAKLNAISENVQRLESIYQQKLAALEDLKKSLLHQAFNGGL